MDRLKASYDTISILEKDKDSANRMHQEAHRMIRVMTVMREYIAECDDAYGEERMILPLGRWVLSRFFPVNCWSTKGGTLFVEIKRRWSEATEVKPNWYKKEKLSIFFFIVELAEENTWHYWWGFQAKAVRQTILTFGPTPMTLLAQSEDRYFTGKHTCFLLICRSDTFNYFAWILMLGSGTAFVGCFPG